MLAHNHSPFHHKIGLQMQNTIRPNIFCKTQIIYWARWNLILFKAQEFLMLSNIWRKPMIQIHGNTILSMGFNPKIKAHGSNSWQYYLINGIQSHSQCPWFKPMANYLSKSPISISNIKSPIFIGNIKSLVLVGNIKKAQFPLTTSNAQFLLAISKAQFMLTLFYQKPNIINARQKISCLFHLEDEHYFLNITMAKTMAIVL